MGLNSSLQVISKDHNLSYVNNVNTIDHNLCRHKTIIYLTLKNYKYYLIHEKECFIIFKTRGAAERFRYDKTRLFECIK